MLREIAQAARELDDLAPVRQLLREWRSTAEVHANPVAVAPSRARQDGHRRAGVSAGEVSRRGDRVPVPATGTQWELRFSTKAAAANWALACQQIPQAVADCFTACRGDPRQRTARHHPLRGDLATRVLHGRTMQR